MEITIANQQYPARLTMGAIREFKVMTGKEIEDVKGSADISDFLFCCVKSTCRAEQKEFELTPETFADGIEVANAFETFTNLMEASGLVKVDTLPAPGQEKKS